MKRFQRAKFSEDEELLNVQFWSERDSIYMKVSKSSRLASIKESKDDVKPVTAGKL